MKRYTYEVTKTIFPYGKDDPVTLKFEISLWAETPALAEWEASQIGFNCGLLLVGPK